MKANGKRIALAMAAIVWCAAGWSVEITGVSVGDRILMEGINEVAMKVPGSQTLNSGNYTITLPGSTIDITGGGYGQLEINGGTSLTITASRTPYVIALQVGDVLQSGGSVTVKGGRGIHVDDTSGGAGEYVMDGGTLVIEDGGDVFGSGFILNAGTVTVRDGGHLNAGIIQKGGVMDFLADDYPALGAGDVRIEDGSFRLVVTDSAQAMGADIANAFYQDGGEVYIAGANNSIGLYVLSPGGGLFQTDGIMTVKSGNGTGIGIAVAKAHIGGTLILERGGTAATVESDAGFLFKNTATLYVDIAGTGELGHLDTIGVADIEAGAKFGLLNTASIAAGQTITHDFLRTDQGIAGEFELITDSSLTLSIEKNNSDKNYGFTVTRTGQASDILPGHGVDRNARQVVYALETLVGGTSPEQRSLRDLYSVFDHLTTDGDIADYANHLALQLTPETFARTLNHIQTLNLGASRALQGALADLDFSQPAVSVISSDSATARLMDANCLERVFYAAPLAQWTRFSRPSSGFSSVDDFSAGAGLGFGVKRSNDFAIGGGVYYLRSDLDSHTADIDTDVYGINLYGRKYFGAASCRTTRWFVEGGLGFAYGDIDQTRKTNPGGNTSDTDSQLYNVKLALGVDMDAGCFTFTPKLGLDYNHIRTGSYTESGLNGLHVNPDNYDSFQGILGLEVKGYVSPALFVTANAAYRYEFADRTATVRNAFTVAPGASFVTKGFEQARSRGELGAGLGWQVTDRVLLGANYDFYFAEKETSHALRATLGISF